MAVLAEKTPARRTSQKTNFSKNGLNDGLNAESSQKLLFYLLEKMDKLDNKFDQKVDKLDEKMDKLDNKLDSKVDKLDEKIDRLENKLDDEVGKLNKKIDDEVGKLNNKISDEIGKLDAKMDNRFLWMIGIMFTGFTGVITIILSKF